MLTCAPDTNDAGATYEWYDDNGKITGASSNTYSLPDNKRTNSGSYQCKVTTSTVPTPQMSDAKTVTFLCEFRFVPSHSPTPLRILMGVPFFGLPST